LGTPRLLRGATLATLVVALAGPERVHVVERISSDGMAIALAIDLSTSMLAEDMSGQSRLEVAREAAVRFAASRPADELALVGFGGQAFTRIPPTTDKALVMSAVESLDVDLVRNGTDISGAILTSLARLLETEREPRVIVLLTDGAHNAAGVLPLVTARAAATMGVRIHAIGILSPDQVSGTSGAVPGSASEEVETVLQGVSSLTGGRYFQAKSAADLDAIYREIDRMEEPVPRVTEVTVRHSARPWLLALVLLVVACDVAVRGSRWGVIP
jgi:Ca-activated chloride channel family protein